MQQKPFSCGTFCAFMAREVKWHCNLDVSTYVNLKSVSYIYQFVLICGCKPTVGL